MLASSVRHRHYPRTHFASTRPYLGRMVVPEPFYLDPSPCSLKLKIHWWSMWCAPRSALVNRYHYTPVMRWTIFSNHEWGEGWHEWMNEWMRIWNDMKKDDWKVENVGGMKLEDWRTQGKTPKYPDIAHQYIVFLATWVRDPYYLLQPTKSIIARTQGQLKSSCSFVWWTRK